MIHNSSRQTLGNDSRVTLYYNIGVASPPSARTAAADSNAPYTFCIYICITLNGYISAVSYAAEGASSADGSRCNREFILAGVDSDAVLVCIYFSSSNSNVSVTSSASKASSAPDGGAGAMSDRSEHATVDFHYDISVGASSYITDRIWKRVRRIPENTGRIDGTPVKSYAILCIRIGLNRHD